MLQRLPISLPQVKTGSTSESLLNQIRRFTRFISSKINYWKVYNNLMNSIKLKNRMDTIFIVEHLIIKDYYSIFHIKLILKNWLIDCFIKPWHLLYMEK